VKIKLNLDKDTLQQALFDHVEKIVLGGVGVCFLLFAYGAATRDSFPETPENLSLAALAARAHIQGTDPKDVGEVVEPFRQYTEIVEQIRNPVSEALIEVAVVPHPPLALTAGPAPPPPLFAVEGLLGAPGRGAFLRSSRVSRGIARAGSQETEGRRWVVLTGLVPAHKQQEAYQQTFQNSEWFNPATDIPQYVGYRVERAEVTPDGATSQWVKLDVAQAVREAASWSNTLDDTIDPRFINERLTFPLGPLASGRWGYEVVHPDLVGPPYELVRKDPTAYLNKKVTWTGRFNSSAGARAVFVHGVGEVGQMSSEPLYFAVDFPSQETVDQFAGAESVTGTVAGLTRVEVQWQDPGTGTMSVRTLIVPLLKYAGTESVQEGPGESLLPGGELPGMFPGMPQARTTRGARAAASIVETGEGTDGLPEYTLFRFFDFNVEPGKKYRYRVRLILANPFYSLEPKYLNEEMKKLREQVAAEYHAKMAAGDRVGAATALAKWAYMETPPSEESEPIGVPPDTQLLAASVSPPLRAVGEPSATVMVVRWVESNGEEAFEVFGDIKRGTVPNYPGRQFPPGGEQEETKTSLPLRAPASESAGTFTVDYITNAVILDLRGGGRLPGRDADIAAPGRILLLQPDGTLEVRDELEDEPERLRHQGVVQPETEEGLIPPGGETGPLPSGEELFQGLDVDDFGTPTRRSSREGS